MHIAHIGSVHGARKPSQLTANPLGLAVSYFRSIFLSKPADNHIVGMKGLFFYALDMVVIELSYYRSYCSELAQRSMSRVSLWLGFTLTIVKTVYDENLFRIGTTGHDKWARWI